MSFKATDESGTMRAIDFRKKKNSVFLDQDDVDGLKDGANTIQRNKLPSRSQRARDSNFGFEPPPSRRTALQRKSSTYSENPCGESVRLSEAQRALIEDANGSVFGAIKSGIEALDGAVSFDKETNSLRLILQRAAERKQALQILKDELGPLSVDGADGSGAKTEKERMKVLKSCCIMLCHDALTRKFLSIFSVKMSV